MSKKKKTSKKLQLEKEATSYCFDKGYNLTPKQARELAELGYIRALCDVRVEVSDLIKALNKFNPDALGSLRQCLAHAEIVALETVVEILIELTVRDDASK